MAAIKRMDQILHILKIYQHHRSIKATVRTTGCARNTVRTYLALTGKRDPDLNVILALPPDELREVFYPGSVATGLDLTADAELHLDDWIAELNRPGVTRQLLWQEYRARVKNGYGYTKFCNLLRAKLEQRNLTLPLDHDPGDIIQFDFTGKKLDVTDPDSGEVTAHEVLVAILPCSQYTFAIALPSQRIGDFVHGIVQALIYFGGTPKAIKSDNLKSFVIRPHKYEPTFNEAIRQLAAHYRVDLVATRPYKPKDKAAVEGAVTNVYRKLFAPLRDEVFTSLRALNAGLFRQLDVLNNAPFQKREGSRRSIFETTEKSLLRPLPSTPFQLKTTVKHTVSLSYHVYLGQRGNYYSVPFQYARKKAVIVYDESLVEIFVDGQRVALHERCHASDRGRHVTDLEHMPRSHREWKNARGFDRDYFVGKAAKIGPVLVWAITRLLDSRYHETHAYRTCQGVLRLGDQYGNDRLENAAIYLQPTGKAGYLRLKNVLDKKLDLVVRPPELFTSIVHENVRDPGHFQ